jgi:hypothetical protein
MKPVVCNFVEFIDEEIISGTQIEYKIKVEKSG